MRRRLKLLCFSVLIVLVSVFGFLTVAELILAAGFFDMADDPSPVARPWKARQADFETNKRNHDVSVKNPFYFNDIPRSVSRAPGTVRVAVLGDSYIWGDGLEPGEAWGHQLERQLCRRYSNVETMSWGILGWRSSQELAFLADHGSRFDIDLLIMGFVENDPVFNNCDLKRFTWQESCSWKNLEKLFPGFGLFFSSYLNNVLTKRFLPEYDEERWLNCLYSEKNLKEYQETLKTLTDLSKRDGFEVLYVLTPGVQFEKSRFFFDKIIPVLEEAGFKVLDLEPGAEKQFGTTPVRQRWASSWNAHPGKDIAAWFGAEVADWLEHSGTLARAARDIPLVPRTENSPSLCQEARTAREQAGKLSASLVDLGKIANKNVFTVEIPKDFTCPPERVLVLEDGALLKKTSSDQITGKDAGGGLFAVKGKSVLFSARNSGDCAKNGRRYTLVDSKTGHYRDILFKDRYYEIFKINSTLYYYPEKAEAFVQKANIVLNLKAYPYALILFEKGARLDPENHKILNDMARCLADMGDLEKAAKMLFKAARLAPESAEICYNLACVYSRMNEPGKCKEWLLAAIERGFKNRKALEKDEALENFRKSGEYAGVLALLKEE
jgi:tetratricopeptide (TPR) repeat protein